METINFAEQKLMIFNEIMKIKNEKKLNQLMLIIEKFSKTEEEQIKLTFEEWNKIFMKEVDLDEFIPEYNMTLGEYRHKIYNSEMSKSYDVSKFLNKLENYV